MARGGRRRVVVARPAACRADEALAAVLARVRESAVRRARPSFGETDELPTALAEELAGVWPVLRELGRTARLGSRAAAAQRRPLGRRADRVLARGRRGPQLDLPSIAGFGEQLALALDVADAQADRARLAVLEDRERIARDLHDMVIQRLFAIGLDVQGAAAHDAVRPEVARRLEAAVDDLDETIKDVRTTIFRLGAASRRRGRPGCATGSTPRWSARARRSASCRACASTG